MTVLQRIHGFELADNGFIRKLRPEVVQQDPTDLVTPGRIWYNSSDHQLKFSDLDDKGTLITRVVLDEVEVQKHSAKSAKESLVSKITKGIDVVDTDPEQKDQRHGALWLNATEGKLKVSFADDGLLVKSLVTHEEFSKALRDYQCLKDGRETSTTSRSYQRRVLWQLPDLEGGDYRLAWRYRFGIYKRRDTFKGRILVNGQTVHIHEEEALVSSSDRGATHMGFDVITLPAGASQVALDWCSDRKNKAAVMRDVMLEIWRVS